MRGDEDLSVVLQSVQNCRLCGGKVVFTNGCFDIIHAGHAVLLNLAADRGDELIVGINSDESVRKIKGPGHPIMPAADRAVILSMLRSVDSVVIFEEESPLTLIKTICPDVLIKGGEYGEGEIVGETFVRAYGGSVIRLPLVAGLSTTEILRRIRALEPVEPLRREWKDEDAAG